LKFRRLRIAVVDDEAHVRKALERLMRGAGFEVATYSSGPEYLAVLAVDPPDCVVLDVHMPGVDGLEVQSSMRASGSHVPVIIITGHDSVEAAINALAGGAFAFLRKPVDGAELIAAITRATATEGA